MKNTNQLQKYLLRSALALAVAALSWLPAQAQDTKPMKPMKGGEHMMMMNKITTKEQADALKSDDSIAMVCAKCQTVYVSHVKQGAKGAELMAADGHPVELIGTHACSGCGGTWTIVGVGKSAKNEYKHTCSMCGSDSGFCCATTTNSLPTAGMETK